MAQIIGTDEEMLYFPYNSEINELGERDRLYDAQDWRDNFALFIGNGVFPNPSNQLRVEAVGGMVLKLRAGNGWIDGGSFVLRRDFEFAVEPAHLTLPRRDVVILRHDVIARSTLPIYIAGVPSISPQVPALVRTDDTYDIRLCEISVGANAQSITQSSMLDTRPNDAVCGFVTGLVHNVDTTELFEQYWAFLQEQIALWEQRHDEQADDWQGQMNQQQSDFDDKMDVLREKYYEIMLQLQAMETQTFSLFNHAFDDISVQRGCNRLTEFRPDGSILETIRVVAEDFVLATRETTFSHDGSILETINFNPWERTEGAVTTNSISFTMAHVTIFNADGTILQEVR